MEVKDDLTDYEFIDELKNRPGFQIGTSYQFSYDNFNGKDLLLPKDNNARMLRHNEVKAIIAGLINFLETTSDEKISEYNKPIIKQRELELKQNNGKSNNTNNRRKAKSGIVYLLKIKNKSQYKIGVTTKLQKRVDDLSTQMPFELQVEHKIKSDNIYSLEEKLHQKFKNKQIKGEWFELDKKEVNYIKSL